MRQQSLYFQDPCTPIMESLIDLHTFIMFYVVGIVVLVSVSLILTVYEFSFVECQDKLEQLIVLKVVHCTWLELFWTLAPVGVLLSIALPSFSLLYAMEEKSDYNLTVKAVGHQWYWEYQVVVNRDWLTSSDLHKINFDSYMKADDDLQRGDLRLLEVDRKLVLPLQTPIRLLTTSADVIHSWALPSAGVKMDAVPGRLNQVNLYFNRQGIFYGQCSELCGVNHGFMPICLKVVEPATYQQVSLNQLDHQLLKS